jgi:hypothetical protein
MGRFLMLWKENSSLVPVDMVERGKIYGEMLQWVKDDLKSGSMKDWGLCPGNSMGYAIFEGDESDIAPHIEKYRPYIKFKTYPVVDADTLDESMKKLRQG